MLRTVRFSKTFTSGLLKGLTVRQLLTGDADAVGRIRVGLRGQDAVTGAKWVVVAREECQP